WNGAARRDRSIATPPRPRRGPARDGSSKKRTTRSVRRRELLEQRAGGPQIRGVEPLPELAPHRLQEPAPLSSPAALAPQAGAAGRAPQRPRERVLARGPFERGGEVALGAGRGLGPAAAQQELALAPEQLGDDPARLGAPGAAERLVDQRE